MGVDFKQSKEKLAKDGAYFTAQVEGDNLKYSKYNNFTIQKKTQKEFDDLFGKYKPGK